MHKKFSARRLFSNTLLLTLLCVSHLLQAAELVRIDNAWVRSTFSGQDVSVAYMTLTSTQNTSLLSIESNVTKSVEIHSMSMQNGVMKMRMLKDLPLTAGKPYKLEPGGFHLMLFDLKKPLTVGEQVNLELKFKTGNQEFKQQIKVLVKAAADEGAHDHGHHHH